MMVAASDTVGATLHQTLASCSKSIEAGDYSKSEESIAELVNFLNSISDSLVAGERGNEDPEKIAVEILTQIHQYMASPTVKQEVIDALAFELPKAVARFACVSTKCLEIAEDLVHWFIEKCSPRDMLSILCEAIGSPSELFTVPGYFIPLLGGLMKVLVLIQRQHYQQVKSAIPVILNVLKTVCSMSDDEDTDHEKLFHKATGIAYSIRSNLCKPGEDKKKLRALLGLYVLQIMALASFGITSDILKCLSVVVELSDFLQHCELSYVGLITGCEVDTIYKLVVEDDSKDGMDCFSQAKLGAALAAAKANLPVVIMELQSNWARRCEAIGMLKYILSCANLPWELKQHGIRFLLRVMDGIVSYSYDDHAVEMVIMYAPDSALRKDAFSAFKKVLADIPTSVRFDVLSALIMNSDSSSMVLSALNLYRFILITESSGNSNSTGILSKDKLQKAYNEWLLPLRTLVTGTMAESQKDYENLACDTICALNPVELVLYRCIELVEEKLKQY
ncbi:UNVERIFIED_CONTAM: Aberrant root formation protein 4 [Sesamum angustifolium]|uniref:Aberrant root formation protein 4 n=1 Tax=Sesamum angustifolium TaxID=2727405 RepID=A0AAW2MSN5_9LAMI